MVLGPKIFRYEPNFIKSNYPILTTNAWSLDHWLYFVLKEMFAVAADFTTCPVITFCQKKPSFSFAKGNWVVFWAIDFLKSVIIIETFTVENEELEWTKKLVKGLRVAKKMRRSNLGQRRDQKHAF